jgi:hypothetical protein
LELLGSVLGLGAYFQQTLQIGLAKEAVEKSQGGSWTVIIFLFLKNSGEMRKHEDGRFFITTSTHKLCIQKLKTSPSFLVEVY